jgi:large subunit ribosomal protein L10
MAKTRQQKESEVQDLNDRLTKSKGVVFASYKGLTVSQTEELRKVLRAEGAELKMAKKNLLQLVMKKAGLDDKVVDNFTGSVTVAFGYDDEISPARVMAKFSKTNQAMELFGGLLENSFINADRVKALATLPGREELLAKLVGTINAPVAGFVRVLAGNMRNLVYVLEAIKTSKK